MDLLEYLNNRKKASYEEAEGWKLLLTIIKNSNLNTSELDKLFRVIDGYYASIQR